MEPPEVERPVTEIINIDDFDDVFCYPPISKRGTTKNTAISVEQYSADRDLNLAIMASLNSSTGPTNTDNNFVDLTLGNYQDYYNYYDFAAADYDDEIKVLDFTPQFKKRKTRQFRDSVTEEGQSSNPRIDPDFVCEICVEPKSANESFSIKGCSHSYCKDCVNKYVASKLQENISNIRCPVSGCSGLLEPEYCRVILPQQLFDRWGNALCEAVILGSEKFYCPYKDCSAMMIDDGGEAIRESECPNCRRFFCAQCKVPWHVGITCEEFMKLHKDERERDDILLMNLAQNKQWRRCPACRIYVERTQGCRYIRCRCGISFCYSCGSTTISTASHYCPKCKG